MNTDQGTLINDIKTYLETVFGTGVSGGGASIPALTSYNSLNTADKTILKNFVAAAIYGFLEKAQADNKFKFLAGASTINGVITITIPPGGGVATITLTNSLVTAAGGSAVFVPTP